jgi:hypothetical protein
VLFCCFLHVERILTKGFEQDENAHLLVLHAETLSDEDLVAVLGADFSYYTGSSHESGEGELKTKPPVAFRWNGDHAQNGLLVAFHDVEMYRDCIRIWWNKNHRDFYLSSEMAKGPQKRMRVPVM